MKPTRRLRLKTSCALAALAAAAAVGGAAPAGASGPAIQINPTYGPPMTVIKVTGTGFCTAGCGPVAILITSLYVANNVQVDAAGRFSTLVRVPDSVRPGAAQVVAQQDDSQGNPRKAYGTFTVTMSQPAPTHYSLTGSPPAPGGLPPASAAPTRPTHGTSPGKPPTQSSKTKKPTARASTTAAGAPVASQSATPAAATGEAEHSSNSWVWLVLLVAGAAGAVAVAWATYRSRQTRTPAD